MMAVVSGFFFLSFFLLYKLAEVDCFFYHIYVIGTVLISKNVEALFISGNLGNHTSQCLILSRSGGAFLGVYHGFIIINDDFS